MLIQDNMENFAAEESCEEHALLVNRSHGRNKPKSKGVRCYRCNGYGHVQKDCPTEDSEDSDTVNEDEAAQQPNRKSKPMEKANLVILGRGDETY